MRRVLLVVSVVAAWAALSAGTLTGGSGVAEAKPELVYGDTTFDVDGAGNCIATVTWSGVKGGKLLLVQWIIRGGPDPQPSGQEGVKQGDLQATINLGPVSLIPTGRSLELVFLDRREGFILSPDDEPIGTCT